MVTGIHHTGVVVSDLQLVQQFYTEVLGLRVLGEIDSVAPPEGNHTGISGARRKLVFLAACKELESHLVELVQYVEPPAAEGHLGKHQLGASHLCFIVDDLQMEHERLLAAGVRFETEPKFSEGPGGRIGIVYARDPEGNWLEFIEGDISF
jgi:catechol 2,3-dioxygenase-like lactoylglutathione lyase family enzyme